jgi:hypothetical protein
MLHVINWEGADTMTVSGLETQQFPQTVSSVTQEDRLVTGVRPTHNANDKTKEQQEPRTPSPIQDHVTLSKEAQELSAFDPQTSKNNTFQRSF